ncbi:MAG TPA: hypothetical protein PKH58_01380 [Paludibacteraceae bacterium]|nr:hypothetical protein [Paludibacteraceae bacterium]
MIITTIAQLKDRIATVKGADIKRYEPYLATADLFLQSELIGSTLYGKLNATGNETLLTRCQDVVALKAYHDAIPFLDLIETETGFGVVSSGGSNLVPASRERVDKLIAQTEIRLSGAIELLLQHLEETTAYHTDWATASAYSIIHDSYIFTLTEFRRYARYDASRLEFVKDAPKIQRAIRYIIEPVISRELSLAIITQLKAGNLNDANKVIIEDLRFALALYVTGEPVAASASLAKVKDVLYTNPDSYPEFKASNIYTAFLAQEERDTHLDPFMVCGM